MAAQEVVIESHLAAWRGEQSSWQRAVAEALRVLAAGHWQEPQNPFRGEARPISTAWRRGPRVGRRQEGP